jgi:beta-galactosidase/beta-glucuronidase
MPAGSTLRTPWRPAEDCPLPEYPRPQMMRPKWVNLNGLWDYTIRPENEAAPQDFEGKILVPYALESVLSGVQKQLYPDQKLWYHRTFADPRPYFFKKSEMENSGKILLHFGAVDYACEIWVNGIRVGEHRGGYLPFTLDISEALHAGENELVVSVWDPTDTGYQQRGKQVLKPKGIWYTAISGIWQTVWLEGVPVLSIKTLKLTPDLVKELLTVEVNLRGAANDSVWIEAEVFSNGEIVTSARTEVGNSLEIIVPDPQKWSPADPHLYDLQVRLIRDDKVFDEVGSYFGMREFGVVRDSRGHLRFTLNGEKLFLYGPLDQGYFPDGLYTPPSDDALLFDIKFARSIGCNMIRKHVKVEPQRWYYHCDRLGMIVWQDMPNGGLIDGEAVAVLSMLFGFQRNDTRRLGRFGRAEKENRDMYRAELQEMVDHLYNAVCVAVWVPFNESWGQFYAKQTAEWLKAYDPTRLVDHASGWFDQGGGDFLSKHIYFKRLKRPRSDKRAFVLSEFGGYSLKIQGHLWDDEKKFGYRFYDSREELTEAYLNLLKNELKPLIEQGLAAAIYTQTTDVEIEINGFLTYDRQVEKMEKQAIERAHRALINENL